LRGLKGREWGKVEGWGRFRERGERGGRERGRREGEMMIGIRKR
jgi:hypothetical protein